MNKEITCLLGAGATVEMGNPSTEKVTKEVEQTIKVSH